MEPQKKKQKLSWNKIKKEGLDLDYNQRFLTKHEADDLLEWFEKNVEYFSGDLAQVKVFGKWHQIPRKQVGEIYLIKQVELPRFSFTYINLV